MSDKEPNLDDVLVPGTPEVPFSSPRSNEGASSHRNYRSPDTARYGELYDSWVEGSCDRVLWTCTAFLLIGMICFLFGLYIGAAKVSCY